MHVLGGVFTVKSLADVGRFAGYASVFGVVDGDRDIVQRGAFEGALHARKGNIKLLWQHQPDQPIGLIERIFEDARGLYVEGQLALNIARGREAYHLLKSGSVTGLSIGYIPVRFRRDPVTGIRTLEAVDLLEISLVTFPANAAAQVTVVKGGDVSC